MKKAIPFVILSILIFSLVFLNNNKVQAAFISSIENAPRTKGTNECMMKVRATRNGINGAVYDHIYYFLGGSGQANYLRASSQRLGIWQDPSYVETYYYNGTNWIADTNTTMDGWDVNTVNMVGPTYADFLSTCAIGGFSNYTLGDWWYGLPNTYAIRTGQLAFNANWALVPDLIGDDEVGGIIINPYLFQITFSTVNPDIHKDEVWVRASYKESNSCIIYSATSTDHRLLCGIHRLNIESASTTEYLTSTTTYYISSTSNICQNIKSSTEDLVDGSGEVVCYKPNKVIDSLMPSDGLPPFDSSDKDWGAFNWLRGPYDDVMNFFVRISNSAYKLTKNILGFLIPNAYDLQNFFSSMYRTWTEQFNINDIIFVIDFFRTSYSNGYANTSYNPNLPLTMYGNTTTINLSSFKTLIFSNSLISNIVQFSMIFMLFGTFIGNIRESFS